MSEELMAVLYARYSPRPEPKETGEPLSKRQMKLKESAAIDRVKNSCDKQIEYGREYCARMGYDLDGDNIFRDDALSGKSMTKREGLRAALAACKRGMIFIARDTKRVSRDVVDQYNIIRKLVKRGAIFETLEEGRYDAADHNKITLFGIRAAIAEGERIRISQDTKTKMRRHQANLRRMSDIVPFGFVRDPDDDSRLLSFVPEQETIERMKVLRHGGESLRSIGTMLEAEGMLCRGRKWQHKTIKRILDRELQPKS